MNVLEIEKDGVLRERYSVVAMSGGQDASLSKGLSPNRLTLLLEKFDEEGANPTLHHADYVFGGFSPGPDDLRGGSAVFNFGLAMAWIMAGRKVARADPNWREEHKFVYLVPGSEFKVSRAPLMGIYPEGTAIRYRPHLDVAYVNGDCGVWSMTQEDIMADDWQLVDVAGRAL